MEKKEFIIILYLTATVMIFVSVGCTPDIKKKDWRVRYDAVIKLTDQKVLAKVATEDEDSNVRQAAIGKVTDQAVLAKVALTDDNRFVRQQALYSLTDQEVLAKVAMEDVDADVRKAAVERLPINHSLHHIVLASKEEVEKNTDQRPLADFAKMAWDNDARKAAVEKLTDQALLAKIAFEDHDYWVRLAAVGQVTDQSVVAALLPKLESLLNNPLYPTLYRIKFAIQEPRIKLRFPGLRYVINTIPTKQTYSFLDNNPPIDSHDFSKVEGSNEKITVKGEIVRVQLHQDGRFLLEMDWSTDFPVYTIFSRNIIKEGGALKNGGFIAAKVSVEDLIKKLLHQPVFTQADMADLIYSWMPEVRIGAAANLTDQVLLAKVTKEDKNADVREAAKKHLEELRH